MALTPDERRALEDVWYAEELRRLSDEILAPLFDKQRAFIADHARRKALLCSRRAGKTTLIPRKKLLRAIARPGTLHRLFGITRLRAKELFWEDGPESLKQLNYTLQLDARFNETELSVRLPNESVLRLNGADKLGEAKKKVGDKLDSGDVDESQLYPEDVLRALCEDILGPALEDLDGELCLFGTPGRRMTGFWWELTRDDGVEPLPGWSVHRWSVLDNPCFPRWAGKPHWKLLAIEWLKALKASKQWADDHPTYMTEWLGRWVNDVGSLVYKYDPLRNGFDGTLPPLPEGKRWRYAAGSDLGKRDAFAIVVWAYCSALKPAYEAFSYSESGLNTDQWEEKWEHVTRVFNPYVIRVDTGGLGSVIIDTIKAKRATEPGKLWLPLEAAEKNEKAAHQQLMNNEFLAGNLFVNRNGPYARELSTLAKDPDDPDKEDERYANHVCDGGLYGFRQLLRTHFKERPQEPDTDKPKDFDADAYRARVAKQMTGGKEPWWARTQRR